VLRAAGETETTQENIQDWLELEEISAVIFLYLFSSTLPILLNFPFIYFLRFVCLLGLSFASLTRIIA
jgi:hypothetical protein